MTIGLRSPRAISALTLTLTLTVASGCGVRSQGLGGEELTLDAATGGGAGPSAGPGGRWARGGSNASGSTTAPSATRPDGAGPAPTPGDAGLLAPAPGEVAVTGDTSVIPPPSPGFVDCGEASCPLATSYCCVSGEGAVCRLRNTACSQGGAVSCDGAEDCGAGEGCCGRAETSDPGALRAECRTPRECDRGKWLCHTSEDCPAGTRCCAVSGAALTYGACLARCG